jgi:hypothetical protein
VPAARALLSGDSECGEGHGRRQDQAECEALAHTKYLGDGEELLRILDDTPAYMFFATG